MKLALITSALAAALIAAAPVPASAKSSVSVGVSVGSEGGSLTILAHGGHGRHGHHSHGHGHHRRCEGWPLAHRKLEHRFNRVRLIGQTRNRIGQRIFIARAFRAGHQLRLRYNACLGRVVAVTHVR